MSYQQFIDDIILYSSKVEVENNYIVFYLNKYLKIDKFESKVKSSKIFLIIPSIFNSTKIFFTNIDENLIEKLKYQGDVYLINWLDNKEVNFSFNDYIKNINIVINLLYNKIGIKINLIGHCIGGNMALACTYLNKLAIGTLMLITVPWEFSHLKLALNLSKIIAPIGLLQNLSYIPKIYSQILFCIFFADQLEDKINKYNSLDNLDKRSLFLNTEDWLLSGKSIPKKAYLELIEMIDNNIFYNQKWYIDNILINISDLNLPIYQVAAIKDRLVPLSSILPLHHKLTNVKLKQVEGGHINFLISKKLDTLFKDYSKWIQGW